MAFFGWNACTAFTELRRSSTSSDLRLANTNESAIQARKVEHTLPLVCVFRKTNEIRPITICTACESAKALNMHFFFVSRFLGPCWTISLAVNQSVSQSVGLSVYPFVYPQSLSEERLIDYVAFQSFFRSNCCWGRGENHNSSIKYQQNPRFGLAIPSRTVVARSDARGTLLIGFLIIIESLLL